MEEGKTIFRIPIFLSQNSSLGIPRFLNVLVLEVPLIFGVFHWLWRPNIFIFVKSVTTVPVVAVINLVH